MTKDQILAALPGLSHEDQAVIASVASHLCKGRTGAIGQPATQLGATVYEALGAALASPVPYATFAASKWGRAFDAKVLPLGKWFDSKLPGWDKNKVGQMALLRMLFELLSQDLLKRSVPTNMGTMVSNLGQIPRIFDQAFPNYIESGLGPFILKKFGM